MAGLFQRVRGLFSTASAGTSDPTDDPREGLEQSYQKQLELLQQVRRGVAEVAASRRRVGAQVGQVSAQLDKLNASDDRAAEDGRDLVPGTLNRQDELQQQLAELQTRRDALQSEEDELIQAGRRLQARVEAFRTRKDAILATYTAAAAQTRIREAVNSLNQELGEVGQLVERAHDEAARLQTGPLALDELATGAALDDPTTVRFEQPPPPGAVSDSDENLR